MTRFLIASDLHFEHRKPAERIAVMKALAATPHDVALLAGDLCNFELIEDTIAMVSDYLPYSIVVCGNHECYGGSVRKALERQHVAALKTNNVHALENETLRMTGHRIHGATMWFPQKDSDDVRARRGMNDFVQIADFDPHERCSFTCDWLNEAVDPGDIVLTHHLPSYLCVHPQYARSMINRFFVCPQDILMDYENPALWVFGHTHVNVDMQIYGTRCFANPLGYPNERFDWEPEVLAL